MKPRTQSLSLLAAFLLSCCFTTAAYAMQDYVSLSTTSHTDSVSGSAEGSKESVRDGNSDTYYGAYHHHGGDGNAECSVVSQHTWTTPTPIEQIKAKLYARPYPHGNYEHQKYSFRVSLKLNGVWTSVYSNSRDFNASTPGWQGHEYRDVDESTGWDNVTGIKCEVTAWAYSYEGDRQQDAWARVYEVQAFGYSLPSVTTLSASDVQAFQATMGGEITDTGGTNCDMRRFEWGISPGDYTDNWTETGSFGTASFPHTLTDLELNTQYYYRVSAHNPAGWGYGPERSFTTSGSDIGLRLFDGMETIKIACETAATGTSPLRIAKDGAIYSIILVEPGSSGASNIRINTSSGTKALGKID